jgi:O-antigen ligase
VASEIELRESKEYYAPIAHIVVGLAASALYNEIYRSGLGIIKSWFIIPLIFSWVSLRVLKNKNILTAIYSSAFLVACLSVIYFLLGELTFDGRLQAFYDSPNFLAMFLAPAVIIGIFLFKENKKIYLGTLPMIVISLYLTQSYAAWLAVFAAVVILALIKKELLRWKVALALILIASASFFLQKETDKFNSLVKLEERSSMSSRMMIWSSAIKIGMDNPMIGIGPGNFQNKYLEYQKYFSPYLEWAVPQPHNLLLAFWLQTGLLGASGFLWIIFLWFRGFMQKNEKQKEDYICLGILIYIIIHGLVDTPYFKNDLAVVFWLIIFAGKKRLPRESRRNISDERHELKFDPI